jgi:hypothetical protein
VRWALIAVVLATVVGVAFAAGGASPKAPTSCTWIGTPARDVKTGTPGHNVLCSRPGDDYVHGAAGNDVVRAGGGRDVAVGGGGRDVLRGGGGNDRLFAVDGRGGENAYGGPGRDQCFIDPGDAVYGCEQTFRSHEPELATSLGQSLRGVMEIVEEVTPSLTIPPPVVTVTSIVTVPPNCGGHPAPPPIC